MSPELQARDPDFAERVRASFAQQGLMSTFAARLDRVEPGLVEIVEPVADGLTQQDGFLHAGVVIAAMDSACGYAALTLMQPDFRVRSVELNVNRLSVASGNSCWRGDRSCGSGARSRSAAGTLMPGRARRNVTWRRSSRR